MASRTSRHLGEGSEQVSQPERRSLGGRLLVGVLLNLAMVALQLAGGLAAHSLALLSDAAHNGGDVAALLAVYTANRMGRSPRSAQLTYAYGRWEVLVALVNAVVLLAISAFIIAEAIGRLLSPVAVTGGCSPSWRPPPCSATRPPPGCCMVSTA